MIGLDTNVLVRYIAQDELQQSATATELMETMTAERPGFIALVSVVELVWVFQSCYRATKGEIIHILETMLRTRELVVESADVVWQALRCYTESTADFADCLIERSANAAECEYTVTFDSKAAKTAGMRYLRAGRKATE